jgi:tetratricopeptide (TPR) repeat protein
LAAICSTRRKKGDDAPRRAQELMYDAWDADTKRERIALAKRALEISDSCADAHVMLAQEAAKNDIEARRHYEAGVAAGEKALGAKAFEEDVGHFWGILETRPYMRARAGLAQCLWEQGERSGAIAHLQDMLRLNPGDNQGLRYTLAGWLLAVHDHEALEKLFEAYDDDAGAEWAYSKALLAFRQHGPSPRAKAALKTAWTRNAFVPDLLIGARKIPRRIVEYYSLGSKEEAVFYALANQENWSATEGALQWLHDATRNLPPPTKKHR